jgi:sortase A
VTRFSCAVPWLRRGEIALWVIGFSLLGWALAAILIARVYQARQERAFFPPDMKRTPATRGGGDPLVLGRIEIPRIGVTAIVREGDDDTTLAIAVGHISGTARPGERGNMALAGHRDSFFRALRDIQRQDTIRIATPRQSYEYVVDSTEVVGPDDTRVLDPTSDTVLTLVTCYPFKYVGHAPNRFIVRASLVRLLPAAASGEEVSRARGDLSHDERAQR